MFGFGGGGEGGGDNQEVEHQSGCSRFGNSILCALIGAPLLMLISMILLGWNEKRAVCQSRAITAGKAAVVQAGCTSATQGSGDLVMFSCDLDNSSLPALSPPAGTAFSGLSHRGPGLATKSEMYQCVESKREEKRQDSAGGGQTTVTTYTYSKAWRSSAVSSALFRAKTSSDFRRNCNADNPSWPSQVPVSATKRASSARVGPFTIGQSFVSQIPLETPVTVQAVPAGWTASGSEYTSSRWQVARSDIGRVRVSFKGYNAAAPRMTVLGKNSNGQVGPWTAPSSWLCSGYTLSGFRTGAVPKDELFEQKKAQNTGLTWFLRFLGFALFWVAFCLCARPLEVVADCIPFVGPCLGDSVAAIATCVSCLPACACTMLIAGIVWVAMRPMVGGPLLLLCCCVFGSYAGFKAYSGQQKRKVHDEADLVGEPVGKQED